LLGKTTLVANLSRLRNVYGYTDLLRDCYEKYGISGGVSKECKQRCLFSCWVEKVKERVCCKNLNEVSVVFDRGLIDFVAYNYLELGKSLVNEFAEYLLKQLNVDKQLILHEYLRVDSENDELIKRITERAKKRNKNEYDLKLSDPNFVKRLLTYYDLAAKNVSKLGFKVITSEVQRIT